MTTPEMRFAVLGPLEAWRDGEQLALGGAKQRSVLAMLLLEANRPVSVDRLIEGVWGDEAHTRARSTIQVYVSTLRKVLEPERGPHVDARIEGRSGGYQLRVASSELDLLRFEEAVSDARAATQAGDHLRAAEHYRSALAEWSGAPLGDLLSAPFALAQISRLEELRLIVTEERFDAELEAGRHADLVPEIEALVAEHPYRERLRSQLMLALYRAGRQADALARYREAREFLADELGLDPSPALRELEQAILAHRDLVQAEQAGEPYVLFGDADGYQRLHPLRGAVTVGRAPGNDLELAWDGQVSRRHAELVPGPTWTVVDLGSRNGVVVNGERLAGPRELADGDVIQFGATILLFRWPRRAVPARVDPGGPTQARV